MTVKKMTSDEIAKTAKLVAAVNNFGGRLLKDQQMPEEQNGTFFLDNGILVRIKIAVTR
jgi:hypothetical protein